jgi:hypothetical protein
VTEDRDGFGRMRNCGRRQTMHSTYHDIFGINANSFRVVVTTCCRFESCRPGPPMEQSSTDELESPIVTEASDWPRPSNLDTDIPFNALITELSDICSICVENVHECSSVICLEVLEFQQQRDLICQCTGSLPSWNEERKSHLAHS